MLISPNTRALVGALNPYLYAGVILAYLATSVPLLSPWGTAQHQNQNLLLCIFLTDIIAMTLMADSSGGMASGLPILLVISVAASAVLMSRRILATLIAALSILAILADTAWLISTNVLDTGAFFPAGLLGILIFGVSLMVQAIAKRLGRAEELARETASDLYNLQRLNEQIVQHMQTGILLVDNEGIVRVMNKAATALLAPDRPFAMERGRQLADYSSELAYQFTHWRATHQHQATPFSVLPEAPQVIAHFRELQPSTEQETLVMVEDYTPITQYAQSLKLTSLGRMTASIAHEIRNPLGAISHAAQLLQESPALESGDQRMADIILHHTGRVNRIVESVMQISRRVPPKPEYLILGEWLAEFITRYLETKNNSAKISLECEHLDLLVEFDPENLERVLSNLLDNGLRHSKMLVDQETVGIAVSIDFGSNQCFVDIVDKGAGVPLADESKLFEPFFTTVNEGSGMGLYLCKELCEINHASLAYRPTQSGASCFRITLKQRHY